MGNRLALIVGVSEYGEGFEPLPGSLRDVQAMDAILKNADRGAFQTQALENCDRSTLEANIEQFFRGKSPDDVYGTPQCQDRKRVNLRSNLA